MLVTINKKKTQSPWQIAKNINILGFLTNVGISVSYVHESRYVSSKYMLFAIQSACLRLLILIAAVLYLASSLLRVTGLLV